MNIDKELWNDWIDSIRIYHETSSHFKDSILKNGLSRDIRNEVFLFAKELFQIIKNADEINYEYDKPYLKKALETRKAIFVSIGMPEYDGYYIPESIQSINRVFEDLKNHNSSVINKKARYLNKKITKFIETSEPLLLKINAKALVNESDIINSVIPVNLKKAINSFSYFKENFHLIYNDFDYIKEFQKNTFNLYDIALFENIPPNLIKIVPIEQ